jgi:phosphoserine phosphatase RsbU/P
MTLDDIRILIVDDNDINLTMLRAIVQTLGIRHIATARTGIEGLTAIAREKPDLVLLDVMMPDMDGYEMCRRLRAVHSRTELPVLFVTGLNDPARRAECFAAGGTDMVGKPINVAEITARVSVHLENRILLAGLKDYRKRVRAELSAARDAQLALLPHRPHLDEIATRTGLHVEGLVETSSELGGDFWTVYDASPRCLGMLVIDFSGHGVAAALNVFRLHGIMNRLPRGMCDPAELMQFLNHELKSLLPPGQFAAAFAGVVDHQAGTLSWSGAASPPPIVIENGIPRTLDAKGPPLGAFADAEYETQTIPFSCGSTVFAYSDALLESVTATGSLAVSDDELLSWLTEIPPGPGLTEAVRARFSARIPGEPPDDLTLMAVHRN